MQENPTSSLGRSTQTMEPVPNLLTHIDPEYTQVRKPKLWNISLTSKLI